ncbi:MAG: endonuclease III [Planctomycetota bacterium]|nr:endonuclease III [Planctomycetota bacterium]
MTLDTPPVGGPRSKKEFDLPKKSEEECRRAGRILSALRRRYPDARCELEFSNAHELLVATILSAQATDVGVNKATPGLFKRFPNPRDYVGTTPGDVEPYVKTLNFWRNKARSVHATMNRLEEVHGGAVPRTMEELLELRGVARKTANVVLGNAFGINMGVVVDTHVGRIARRFDLTRHEAPEKVERDLMALFPRPSWCLLSHLLIFHGRRSCKARGATCAEDAICRRYCSNAVS